jgi:hypothetical protein
MRQFIDGASSSFRFNTGVGTFSFDIKDKSANSLSFCNYAVIGPAGFNYK